VIDPHHHLWDPARFRYPWLEPRPGPDPQAAIKKSYLLDDFLADTRNQGLVKSVHVQAEIARDQSLDETAWLQGIADQHGFPHGIVAWAPLQDGDRAEPALAAHAQHRNLRGVRQLLNWHPDPARSQTDRPDYMTDARWRAGYALLGRFGLSFDLQIYPSQMVDAAALAAAYPDVPVILNHTGLPIERDPDGRERWRRGMRLLAEQPHVSCKISGLGMSDPHWTADSLRPWVLDTIDIFGVERCMFASNFPVDKLYSSFDDLYAAYKTIVAGFSADEQHALFQANAERLYRL
jgi:predicted TIM-barrel fold metal-dependent hydrolase